MCICVGGSSGRELNCDFNPGLRKAVLADLYFWSPSVIQCASCPERLSGFPSKHPFMNRKSALRVPKDRSKEVFADCQSKAYAAALAVESGRASGVDAHGQVCEGSEKNAWLVAGRLYSKGRTRLYFLRAFAKYSNSTLPLPSPAFSGKKSCRVQ